MLIRGSEIDYRRSSQSSNRDAPAGSLRRLLGSRDLLIFAGCLFLFQFSNASLLPLASERLAGAYKANSELLTSALVVVPQVAAATVATWVTGKADVWGRKKLIAGAFLALVARTVLFAWVTGPWLLIAVQILGGLTAAVVGVLTPLVVADCTKNSGLFNSALGAIGMIAGIGATISTTVTGFIAQAFGFTWAFIAISAVALAGVAAVCFCLRETVSQSREDTT